MKAARLELDKKILNLENAHNTFKADIERELSKIQSSLNKYSLRNS